MSIFICATCHFALFLFSFLNYDFLFLENYKQTSASDIHMYVRFCVEDKNLALRVSKIYKNRKTNTISVLKICPDVY